MIQFANMVTAELDWQICEYFTLFFQTNCNEGIVNLK